MSAKQHIIRFVAALPIVICLSFNAYSAIDNINIVQLSVGESTSGGIHLAGDYIAWPEKDENGVFQAMFYDGANITQITDGVFDSRPLHLSATHLACIVSKNTGFPHKYDVLLRDIASGDTTLVAENLEFSGNSNMDGDRMAYVCLGDGRVWLYYFDGVQNILLSNRNAPRDPQVDGNYVVWREYDSNSLKQLMLYDGSDIRQITDLPNGVYNFKMSNSKIVFNTVVGDFGGDFNLLELFVYDIPTQSFTRITNNNTRDVYINFCYPLVVWSGYDKHDTAKFVAKEVFSYNVETGTLTQITRDKGRNIHALTDGRNIMWTHARSDYDQENYDIMLHTEGRTHQLSPSGVAAGRYPMAISGNRAVYADESQGYYNAMFATWDIVDEPVLSALCALMADVRDINAQYGLENTLGVKVSHAISAIRDAGKNSHIVAVNSLTAFIHTVEALQKSVISQADACDLILMAQEIIQLIESDT